MTRFAQFYNKSSDPVFSIEVFPPKTEVGTNQLIDELQKLKAIHPAFVSVTYGALGNNRDLTKDLAILIKQKLDLTTAFHFTCVGSGRAQIRDYVAALADHGIDLVVALRGDVPAGQQNFVPPADGFRYANELVEYLKTLPQHLSLAVAGYPEKHIEAPNQEIDLLNLKRKIDSGADIVLTQLFFDNDDYFNFVSRLRALGVTKPVIPGVLPIQSLKQVEKITSLSGARLPQKLHEDLLRCGSDENAQREVGIRYATTQCQDLLKRGVPGIHFYALNRAEAVLKIVEAC